MSYNLAISRNKYSKHDSIQISKQLIVSQVKPKTQLSKSDEEININNINQQATKAHNKAASLISQVKNIASKEIKNDNINVSKSCLISKEVNINRYLSELNEIQTHMILLAKFRDSTTIKELYNFYSYIYNETQKIAEWYSNYIQSVINHTRLIMFSKKRDYHDLNSKIINNSLQDPNYKLLSSSKWKDIIYNDNNIDNKLIKRARYK